MHHIHDSSNQINLVAEIKCITSTLVYSVKLRMYFFSTCYNAHFASVCEADTSLTADSAANSLAAGVQEYHVKIRQRQQLKIQCIHIHRTSQRIVPKRCIHTAPFVNNSTTYFYSDQIHGAQP